MNLKRIIIASSAMCVVALSAITATPADAATMPVTSSVTTFTAGAPSPAFVLSMTAVTAGTAGQLRVQASNEGSGYWNLDTNAFPLCSTNYYAQSSLDSCGISVTVGGTPVPGTVPTGWYVYWDTSSQYFRFFPPAPYVTQNVGTVIAFTFDPGVFIVNGTGSSAWLSVREAGLIGDDYGQVGGITILVPSVVTFDANGGTGAMENQSGISAAPLASNSFTRTGYTFGGWASSQADADAGLVSFADNENYPFLSSTTLYAIWSLDATEDSTQGTTLAVTGVDLLAPMSLTLILTLVGFVGVVIGRRHSPTKK